MAEIRRFRKKPVIIEAIRYTGSRVSFEAICAWMDGDRTDSPMLGYEGPNDDDPQEFGIKTLEGKMKTRPGDYVIKGIAGEFYPCKPDIFEASYEAVED